MQNSYYPAIAYSTARIVDILLRILSESDSSSRPGTAASTRQMSVPMPR